MSLFKRQQNKDKKGFTIIEMIVCIAIFAFMTAFLVAKYGNFNQSVLLTNLAYDVAITLRNAQAYGLNVKSKPTDTAGYTDGTYDQIAAGYQYAYGVHFDTRSNGQTPRTQMIFFVDINGDSNYQNGVDQDLARYTLRNGSIVSDICVGTSEADCNNNHPQSLDVFFKRPNPDAYFSISGVKYAQITLQASGGGTKKVIVRKTGQIAVLQN